MAGCCQQKRILYIDFTVKSFVSLENSFTELNTIKMIVLLDTLLSKTKVTLTTTVLSKKINTGKCLVMKSFANRNTHNCNKNFSSPSMQHVVKFKIL